MQNFNHEIFPRYGICATNKHTEVHHCYGPHFGPPRWPMVNFHVHVYCSRSIETTATMVLSHDTVNQFSAFTRANYPVLKSVCIALTQSFYYQYCTGQILICTVQQWRNGCHWETVNKSINECAAAKDSKHVSKQRMSIMTNKHTHTTSIPGSELHWMKKIDFWTLISSAQFSYRSKSLYSPGFSHKQW